MRNPSEDRWTPNSAAMALNAARANRRNLVSRIKGVGADHRLARRLFCDDQGQLTSDAAAFFSMLANMAQLGATELAVDPRTETWRAGQAALVMSILNLVDVQRIDLELTRLSNVLSQYNGVDDHE